MKRFLAALCTAFILFTSTSVFAFGPIDLSKYKCSDVNNEDEEDDIILLYFWLDGYSRAKTGGDMKVDIFALSDFGEDLIVFCERHPELTMLQAVDEMKGKK